jgi:TIR domain
VIKSPYPGLRPFRDDEVDCFFGRDAHVNELIERFDVGRFLAVIGPSGCGKTSLIEAGLVPALFASDPRLHTIRVRSGVKPLQDLARKLVQFYPTLVKGYSDEQEAAAVTWARIRNASRGLIEVLEDIPEAHRGSPLIILDQFEDLLRGRKTGDAAEAEALVAALVALVRHDRLLSARVVIGLRVDALGECHGMAGLPEALNRGLYLVPDLSPSELKEAVEKPAKVEGATVAEDLVSQLVQDLVSASQRSAPLPLLQHTLMRIWTKAKEAAGDTGEATDLPLVELTLKHYRDVSGLKSLSTAADAAYAELETERQRRIAETMFRLLCGRTPVSLDARRPVRIQDVAEQARATVDEVKAAVEVFRRPDRGLLTPPAHVPLFDDMDLQIGHEALIQHWGRLDRWGGDQVYDVFLCHNSEDKPRVREVGRLLRDKGILAWLDEWFLRPGKPSSEGLEDRLRSIKAAAVFVGKTGIGPWQRMEISALLRQWIKRKIPVIPVILEDCPTKEPELPEFLADFTWVDLRNSPPNHPDPMNALIYGITGVVSEELGPGG